jgi:DNA primase small subunit
MFHGAIPETFGMKKFKANRSSFPDFDKSGWQGRFSKHIFGTKSKRSKIISELLANGYSSFQKTLDNVSQNIGVKIDPNVTMDIHRIFRLPGSINSKSGLTKIFCENLQKFDPYTEASLITEDSIEVFANCPFEFKLKNRKFGPYLNEKVTIPRFAAVYLICKKLASLS